MKLVLKKHFPFVQPIFWNAEEYLHKDMLIGKLMEQRKNKNRTGWNWLRFQHKN